MSLRGPTCIIQYIVSTHIKTKRLYALPTNQVNHGGYGKNEGVSYQSIDVIIILYEPLPQCKRGRGIDQMTHLFASGVLGFFPIPLFDLLSI